MGDAARFADTGRPDHGLVFDGRISEDFKLLSGTWVSTAGVKSALLHHLGKQVRDLVVCGENRSRLIALAWFDQQLVSDEELASEELTTQLVRYNNDNPSGSKSVACVVMLGKPASMQDGEINDKGYINTRVLQQCRANVIDACYARDVQGVVVESALMTETT